METERAEAIVLRRQPVTESSLIVTWYTREFGKLKTVAKGARRLKGPFLGKIDLFYLDEIVFLRSRRSDLHLLHECYLQNAHRNLRQSLQRVTAASYVCELVELATGFEDSNPGIYALLADILAVLDEDPPPVSLIWFELRLLEAAGWKPRWPDRSTAGRILGSLAATKLSGVRRVHLSPDQLREAWQTVWSFWDTELGRSPRSRQLVRMRIGN